ncbi:DUF5954 family protein [Streptomyces sp. NPDC056244]|uniref:DUF5954 family protein n=1 Tax=Streptomyces sp. NPDC056244 TaxID=3345762 RepID=UPI0035D7B94B
MTDDWKQQLDALHAGLVRRDDPAAWVREADAVDASQRYPHIALRGPVFGIAAQDPEAGPDWRMVTPAADGTPQQARDGLNSHLWFRAKDDTDDRDVRRELLDAVAVLERDPVNELKVLGVRYRVVRCDEFTRIGTDGLEPPRPTDAEARDASWEGLHHTESLDEGFVLDPGRDEGLFAGAMKLSLRSLAYSDSRFPADVRADSEQAATDYPDIALLPVGFGVAERRGKGWRPRGVLMPTPHDARRMLHSAMTETWPELHEFDQDEKDTYAKAAEELKTAARVNDVHVDDRLFRICRIERAIRMGPDGPEPPRPTDQDQYTPEKIHPTMDLDGTLHYDD